MFLNSFFATERAENSEKTFLNLYELGVLCGGCSFFMPFTNLRNTL